jgi:hypothetical protein
MKLNSEQTAKRLGRADMNAIAYKRSPVRGANFILAGINGGRGVRVFSSGENAEIDISTSKKHNQGVLNVHEDRRTLEAKNRDIVYIPIPNSYSEKSGKITQKVVKNLLDKALDKSHSFIGRVLRERNPLFAPVSRTRLSVKFEPKDVDAEKTLNRLEKDLQYARELNSRRVYHAEHTFWLEFDVDYTLRVPETDFCMLTGIDEVAHFVCALPEKAKTVDEAHDILRPEGVPVGSPRQGEFFFVPISDEEVMHLIGEASLNETYVNMRTKGRNQLERSSSHAASVLCEIGDRKFARGTISDSRKSRHENLQLTQWHEVIRNTEIVPDFEKMREAQRRVTRYWD